MHPRLVLTVIAGLGLCAGTSPLPAQAPDGVASCFETAYNAKDAVALSGCFADTVVVYAVGPDSVRTRVWTRREIITTYERIFARMPQARQRTLAHLREGSYLAVRDQLAEIAPGDTAYGLTVYRQRAGRITGLWAFSEP